MRERGRLKVIITEIEIEKRRIGNVGGGLAEGGRASIAEGGLGWVTNEATMKGGYQNRLHRVRTDHGATCAAERLEGGGGDSRQPINKFRLFRSGINPQSRGRFRRVVGECQYHGEKWKLIMRFENMLGAMESCRIGERGGAVRAGVNLKSSEIEWRWEDEDELVVPSGVNSPGEVVSGDGWVELCPPSGAESLSN